MTINKNIDEVIVLTIGEIVDNITLEFTKVSTNRTEILIPTINSSSLRYLNLTVDTTSLFGGEYNLRVLSNDQEIKKIKVEVLDYKDQVEYNNDNKYNEYHGNM